MIFCWSFIVFVSKTWLSSNCISSKRHYLHGLISGTLKAEVTLTVRQNSNCKFVIQDSRYTRYETLELIAMQTNTPRKAKIRNRLCNGTLKIPKRLKRRSNEMKLSPNLFLNVFGVCKSYSTTFLVIRSCIGNQQQNF